ncbi:ABC transporter permease [Sinomicrobium sp. M5D2P17]
MKLLFINFTRSNSVKIGLSFILLAGVISLLVGKQHIEKINRSIDETARYQKEHIERHAEYNKDDLGLMLYYIKFSIVNRFPALNALSIGQRDVNPSVKSVTIRTLEAQKYDAGLNNPYNLLIGNIDFGFVLVFLFPLLIISFTYNIVSEEKESGIWKIIAVQTKRPLWFILKSFGVRLSVTIGALLLLYAIGVPVLGIEPDRDFLAFLLASVLYVLVWFAICFFVASLQKSSNSNAIILLSIWILLVLVLPAALNNDLQKRYPLPEALETTVKQRKGYHEKWDMDKKLTMDKFYAHYPRFKKYTLPEGDFSWLWYYAMQQMGDDETAEQSATLREKLGQRNTAASRIAQFIPTLHLQLCFNDIARSGLGNQLHFLDETERFHEKLRLHFYPKIFGEASVASENWDAFEVEVFSDETTLSRTRLYMPLLIFIGLFSALGWFIFRRRIHLL